MTIHDNGDIVRAVGYVAIYGAYLEDRIAELIDMTNEVISLRMNIKLLSATDQAKHLLKSLKKEFSNAQDYLNKNTDIERVDANLSAVEYYLKRRHIVIHSTLISKSGGEVIMRKNRRNGTEERVSSKEIIDLANALFELQKQIDGLKFPVHGLISRLHKS